MVGAFVFDNNAPGGKVCGMKGYLFHKEVKS
jgi:hypothetical protein